MEKLSALSIKNLNYFYRSDWTSKKFHALKNIELEVYQGESFGFLGHNGAGKTTTIKCILGLIQPTSGSIKIFNQSNEQTQARHSVGYLPEQPYFYDYLTVQEIMQMYAVLAGVDRGDLAKAIKEALDLVKVSARSKSPMRSLSKGLTQRVGMAQAIVGKPRLLVLDEPFSGLDPIGRKEFKDLLYLLKTSGTTIFISSHILSDVADLCERASIMAYGELKSIFDLQDVPKLVGGAFELALEDAVSLLPKLEPLCDRHVQEGKFIKLFFNNRDQAQMALHQALAANAKIESFQFVRGSLEDLFVKLVKFDEAKSSPY